MSDRFNRRELLKLGVAAAGGAGLYRGLEYSGLLPAWAGQSQISSGGLASTYESLGRWILLAPQKLGGGTHAVDLASGKGLAWISYWNYGDTCPSRTTWQRTLPRIRTRASSSSTRHRAAKTS